MRFVIMDVFFVLLLLDIFSHSFFKLNSRLSGKVLGMFFCFIIFCIFAL